MRACAVIASAFIYVMADAKGRANNEARRVVIFLKCDIIIRRGSVDILRHHVEFINYLCGDDKCAAEQSEEVKK